MSSAAGALAVAGTTVAASALAFSSAPAASAAVASKGHVDVIAVNPAYRAVAMGGWAFDPASPLNQVALHVSVDGRAYRNYFTGHLRPDVKRAYPSTSNNTGFGLVTSTLPYGSHLVCVTRLGVHTGAAASLIGCASVNFPAPVAPVNTRIAAQARSMVGKYPYASGGTSPASGFDCSGLSSYVYRSNGIGIQRTADQQYHQFRSISPAAARPGDLIFFHSGGGTFHVGIYQSPGLMVAAATAGEGIKYQSYNWWSNITFGTLTH